jgi:uncharacterized protein YndB with AHSA1/START domain
MSANETLFSATFLMPAPPATVWQHLREPELLRQWFGWHGPEFEDEIAGLSGGFSAVEREGRSVAIGDHRMVLQEVDPGTELRVSRVGESDEHGIEIDEGWVTFIEQLRYVITVQPAGARHTLMVPGAPATDIPWEHEEWHAPHTSAGSSSRRGARCKWRPSSRRPAVLPRGSSSTATGAPPTKPPSSTLQ